MNFEKLIKEITDKCQNLHEPAIIKVSDWNKLETFIIQSLKKRDYFTAIIDITPVKNQNQLLQALDKGCEFPDYFGFNWDALDECLRDFHWKAASGYILLFRNPKLLDKQDMKIFLEIVEYTSMVWKKEGIPFKLLINDRES